MVGFSLHFDYPTPTGLGHVCSIPLQEKPILHAISPCPPQFLPSHFLYFLFQIYPLLPSTIIIIHLASCTPAYTCETRHQRYFKLVTSHVHTNILTCIHESLQYKPMKKHTQVSRHGVEIPAQEFTFPTKFVNQAFIIWALSNNKQLSSCLHF